MEMRVCRSARRTHASPPELSSPPRRVLLSIFRGVPRASAPPPRPPALLPRPARGRHGSGGARCLARAAPFSFFSGCGPGGGDVPEPLASAAFPGWADVNSFLPRGKEAVCLLPLSRGGPAPRRGPGATGRRPGEKRETWARAWLPPLPTLAPERECPGLAPARASPGQGWRSQPTCYRWPQGWAAAPQSTWSWGGGQAAATRRPGPEEATSAPRPGRLRGARPDLQ